MQEDTLFIGTKRVKAWRMTLGQYRTYRGFDLPEGEDGATAGYLVEYSDGGKPNHINHEGYVSWSPADVFERSYRPATGMNFGLAIEAMKMGERVRRAGWNGKGMYLWLLPAAEVKAEWCREPHLKAIAEENGGTVSCLGSIRMFTATKEVLTGWLASQTDMLSDDWEILA